MILLQKISEIIKLFKQYLIHIDVVIHKKTNNEVDLYVRRSFAEYLWLWMSDSARFL